MKSKNLPFNMINIYFYFFFAFFNFLLTGKYLNISYFYTKYLYEVNLRKFNE